MENGPLKICKPWFWRTGGAGTKTRAAQKLREKTFSGDPSFGRSAAPYCLLPSSETDGECGQVCGCKGRNDRSLTARLSPHRSRAAQPQGSSGPQGRPAAYEGVGFGPQGPNEEISFLQGRSGQNRAESAGSELPYRKWVTDVTAFSLFGEKLCLSPILDPHSGNLVRRIILDRPALSMATSMLDRAFEREFRMEPAAFFTPKSQNQGKTQGLAVCSAQTASPFGCSNSSGRKYLPDF